MNDPARVRVIPSPFSARRLQLIVRHRALNTHSTRGERVLLTMERRMRVDAPTCRGVSAEPATPEAAEIHPGSLSPPIATLDAPRGCPRLFGYVSYPTSHAHMSRESDDASQHPVRLVRSPRNDDLVPNK